MKIIQFWDLFYHLEIVPHIKCGGFGFRCQVSGFRFQVSGSCNLYSPYPDTWHLGWWKSHGFGICFIISNLFPILSAGGFGFRFQVSGVRFQVSDSCNLYLHILTPDAWDDENHTVLGSVLSSRICSPYQVREDLVSGFRFQVSGSCNLYSPYPDTW